MKASSDGRVLAGRALPAVLYVESGWGTHNGFAPSGIRRQGAALAIAVTLGGHAAAGGPHVTLLLVACMLVVAPIFHSVADVPAAWAQRQPIHLLKNVAITGDLRMLAALGSGGLSFDCA